jgi:hypothetical protein
MESTKTPRNTEGKVPDMRTVHLKLESRLLGVFHPLLQEGVRVRARVNCSVREFLCGQLGASPEYVQGRIQTLFLDGRPVDDEGTALLVDGATLALSGAMPGLAGATLRKGGYFSSLRYQISHAGGTVASRPVDGTVTVKLFNTVLKEMAPLLLSRGVLVPGTRIGELLAGQGKFFREGCKEIEIDGLAKGRDEVLTGECPEHGVLLTVETTE